MRENKLLYIMDEKWEQAVIMDEEREQGIIILKISVWRDRRSYYNGWSWGAKNSFYDKK